MQQVKDFQQGTHLGVYKMGNVSAGGVCSSLCIEYLLQRSQGNDFWPWLDKPMNKAKVINTLAGKHDVSQYMTKIYKRMTTDFKWVAECQHVPFCEIFLRMMEPRPRAGSTAAGAYRYVIFETPGFLWLAPAGHAVALVIGSSEVRFFDPNEGEWSFTNVHEFAPWIGSFFRLHYHDRFYSQGTCEVQYLDPKGP